MANDLWSANRGPYPYVTPREVPRFGGQAVYNKIVNPPHGLQATRATQILFTPPPDDGYSPFRASSS